MITKFVLNLHRRILLLSNIEKENRYNGSATTVILFSEERKENIFEVSGEFTVAELTEKLTDTVVCDIQDKGTCIHIVTDVSISVKDVLILLIEKDITISYFRNISNSTRKLFV